MVSSILGVVFQDENCGVVPVGAVRDRFDDAPESEVVAGHRRGRSGLPRARAAGVVVGQVQDDEARKLPALPFLLGPNESLEFVEKLVGAQLIGVVDVERGVLEIGVVLQFGHGRNAALDQRNGPGIGTRAAPGLAYVGWERVPFLDRLAPTFPADRLWLPFFR